MSLINPLNPAATNESKFETIVVLANAAQLSKLVFMEVSGREISSLDHMDESVDTLILSSINKHLAGK